MDWLNEIWSQFIVALGGIGFGGFSLALFFLIHYVMRKQRERQEILNEERRLATIELIKARDSNISPIHYTDNENEIPAHIPLPMEVQMSQNLRQTKLNSLKKEEEAMNRLAQVARMDIEEVRLRTNYLLGEFNQKATSKKEETKPLVKKVEKHKPIKEVRRKFKL